MTTLDELRARVAAERFAEAQRWAWQTAAETGSSLPTEEIDKWPEDAADVPHDLVDAVWFDEQLSPLDVHALTEINFEPISQKIPA